MSEFVQPALTPEERIALMESMIASDKVCIASLEQELARLRIDHTRERMAWAGTIALFTDECARWTRRVKTLEERLARVRELVR